MSHHIEEEVNKHLSKSVSYIEEGNLGEAKNCLSQAHSLNHTVKDLHYVTALYLISVNSLEPALDHLEKELRLFPSNEAARTFFQQIQQAKLAHSGSDRTIRIAAPGHCQTEVFANQLSNLLTNAHVIFHRVGTSSSQGQDFIRDLNFEDYDHVIMPRLDTHFGRLAYENCKDKKNVTFIPFLIFSGYHPDCIYVHDQNDKILRSPIGDYHSLIVYCSFLNDLREEECLKLFHPKFYKAFGYTEHFRNSLALLEEDLNQDGLDGKFLCQKWALQGPFMYSMNHPKQFVFNDIAQAVCRKIGLPVRRNMNPAGLGADRLADGPVFPIYPGLPGANVTSEIYFKQSLAQINCQRSSSIMLSLKEFIDRSYIFYKELGKEQLHCGDPRVELFEKSLEAYRCDTASKPFAHPYRDLEQHHYWSKSCVSPKIADVDPVVNFRMLINPQTKVATAGSCFAQHIARTLHKLGLNYFVAENGPTEEGYGLFSARFGNIYTAKQLLQTFERAYGLFEPLENHWISKDGSFLDPFRPNIATKFNSLDALIADRQSHFAAVRKMFEELDVFVFTLGLTEAWLNTNDGAVYPLAPGVVSENTDSGQYQFVNFSAAQVRQDLVDFIEHLRRVNKAAKIILTVSPVPLIATYENRHVLCSTTHSKSVLRTVADEISRAFSFVEYFPSYEIITGNFNRGSYFADDLRDVRDEGVNHVMSLFIKHCTSLGTRKSQIEVINQDTEKLAALRKACSAIARVICDEELLTK